MPDLIVALTLLPAGSWLWTTPLTTQSPTGAPWATGNAGQTSEPRPVLDLGVVATAG